MNKALIAIGVVMALSFAGCINVANEPGAQEGSSLDNKRAEHVSIIEKRVDGYGTCTFAMYNYHNMVLIGCE